MLISNPYIRILRPQQWIKNLILFSAIFFNGLLFNGVLFQKSLAGFAIFCLISSASYIFNDIIDIPYDRKHPVKKKRPLAAGEIPISEALVLAIALGFTGLAWAWSMRFGMFALTVGFILLHIVYSTYLKKIAILDIFGIATSFFLRILASEILTGYHLSIWMLLTIFFSALFIAATKRHAELLKRGTETRPSLMQYQDRLLNFYASTFATAAILCYILFTFLQPTLKYDSALGQILLSVSLPKLIERKWLIMTTPLFVLGISRFAQLVYEGKRGERPERLITTDPWLVGTLAAWGGIMFVLLYV